MPWNGEAVRGGYNVAQATGQYFSVSYAECDDRMIKGILNQLQKWADEKKQP